MYMRHLLFAGLLAATGCVGGIQGDDGDDGDDGPPPGQAKLLYDRDVYPIVTTKCGAGCHMAGTTPQSTPFVTQAVTNAHFTVTSFESVVGNFTDSAPILTKITTTSHNGRTYTPDEQNKIVAWLAQELNDRAIAPNPDDPPVEESPGAATKRLISEWSGCLQEIDFVELQFGEVWANKGSGGGNCEQCHDNGAWGMWANDDNVLTYQRVSSSKFYLQMFFKASVDDPANRMMLPNLAQFYRVGGNEAPFTEHPSFNPDQQTAGLGVSPIEQTQALYDRTMARKLAGAQPPPIGCGPPIIPQ